MYKLWRNHPAPVIACIVSFIFTLCLSIVLKPIPHNQYFGTTTGKLIKGKKNNCDSLIKNYKPTWYHGNWKVQCTDSITEQENPNLKIFGVTIQKTHQILISRTNNDIKHLKYTIAHEYAHSVVYDHHYNSDPEIWQMWVDYLSNHGVVEDMTYMNDPNEILADNASRCYNHMQNDLMGFITVDCKEINKLFPAFKNQ